jgi:DegV family protein with EDD domain
MPNRKVAIITDSTVNFPKNILEQYPIKVLPLSLIWGEKTYRDTIDIQPDEFYDRLSTSKVTPSTSQVTPVLFETAFKELLDQNYDILCILISSKLSGTLDSAIQAKELFPGARIELFDSLSTSLAMGFQVLSAVRAAEAGATLEECMVILGKARLNCGLYFCVDTLEYLHRGGRIGGASRFLGTALDLKPILELHDGKIIPVERVRTLRKAHDRLIELVGKQIAGKQMVRFGILDAKAPESAEYILQKVINQFDSIEIIRGDVSPVIGTHAGPGTVGVAFMYGV